MSNSASGGNTLPLITEGDATAAGTPASSAAVASPSSSSSSSDIATIRIEGQEFGLERALADDDKTLRSVLRPHYTGIENALITREEKDDRQLVVTIVKRAQHKGSGEGEKGRSAECERLKSEPETFNPALALAAKLGQRTFDTPLSELEIEEATAVLEFSQAEIARIDRWQRNLAATSASASPNVPVGF